MKKLLGFGGLAIASFALFTLPASADEYHGYHHHHYHHDYNNHNEAYYHHHHHEVVTPTVVVRVPGL